MSKVVIVGAGAGGGSAVARALSTKLPSAKITLINPLPYAISRPTLPRYVQDLSCSFWGIAIISGPE
jgi:NADH dehydrogenase FAD-containing subunit